MKQILKERRPRKPQTPTNSRQQSHTQNNPRSPQEQHPRPGQQAAQYHPPGRQSEAQQATQLRGELVVPTEHEEPQKRRPEGLEQPQRRWAGGEGGTSTAVAGGPAEGTTTEGDGAGEVEGEGDLKPKESKNSANCHYLDPKKKKKMRTNKV